jgi:prepilin-type N-terminal cleavage/methylation domain-containing protein
MKKNKETMLFNGNKERSDFRSIFGKNKTKSLSGFTLIEILVAVAILGILSAIVYVSLTSTRNRSADSSIKANLASIIGVSAIIYSTNNNSYGSNFCIEDRVKSFIDKAKSASGITTNTIIDLNTAGSSTQAVCHYNNSEDSWAISVPLKSDPNKSWCVDSTDRLIEYDNHLQGGVSSCN